MTLPGTSIRRRLLVALIGSLLMVWAVILLLVYRVATHEVREVFDADLARSARILQTLLLHEVEEEAEAMRKARMVAEEIGPSSLQDFPHLAAILNDIEKEEAKERLELVETAQQASHKYESRLVFVARYGDGDIMLSDASVPNLPATDDGYSDIHLDGQRWRIFRLSDAATGFSVQVGELEAFRSELVGYITRNTFMPFLVSLPLTALIIWLVVGRALFPLQRIAHAVSNRDPNALHRIDGNDIPTEIRSLVDALNALFERVAATLERERQFTADAAHELRTPLAALKTFLQVAQGHSSEPAVRRDIDQALLGVDRSTHTVEQLMQLAHADADHANTLPVDSVDLCQLAVETVQSLAQQALERQLDLGIDAAQETLVPGNYGGLSVMLRNLVDNAIRYTPEGGMITVSTGRNGRHSWISVKDNGPGIDPADRETVFNRFHRGEGEQAAGTSGSGLGLSIVQRIARLHNAEIELGEGLGGTGLGVAVKFPPYVPSGQ